MRSSERVLALSRALQISGRIAERLGHARCVDELGPIGEQLWEDHQTNAAVESSLLNVLSRVLDAAVVSKRELVLLKFAALRTAGIVRPGSRVAQDLDLLVAEEQARPLWQELLGVGFRRFGASRYEHQLESLVDASDAVVELHVHVPGIAGPPRRFATTTEVMSDPDAKRIARGEGAFWLPSHAFLAAHAISHGLLQNRSAPQAYSPLRMLGDLIDLRVSSRCVAESARWLNRAADDQELAAIERLCALLERGDLPRTSSSPEAVLLAHCLAARLDERYAETLRGAAFAYELSEHSRPRAMLAKLWRSLAPSDAELDALYGPAHSELSRFGQRIRRPFDVAGRAARRWLRRRQ
ncbi:MAG TPA: nucleotidyltransferase family protein [Polyangiaceae bacterium]